MRLVEAFRDNTKDVSSFAVDTFGGCAHESVVAPAEYETPSVFGEELSEFVGFVAIEGAEPHAGGGKNADGFRHE